MLSNAGLLALLTSDGARHRGARARTAVDCHIFCFVAAPVPDPPHLMASSSTTAIACMSDGVA